MQEKLNLCSLHESSTTSIKFRVVLKKTMVSINATQLNIITDRNADLYSCDEVIFTKITQKHCCCYPNFRSE